MANHLNARELRRSMGIEQQEGDPGVYAEGVPIYHGKIDKYLSRCSSRRFAPLPARH